MVVNEILVFIFAEYEEVNLSVQPSNTIDNSGDANLENSENRDIRIEDQQNVETPNKIQKNRNRLG